MKTRFLRLILLAVSVLMTGAAPLAAQQKGQKVPDGVFFKIEKKGQQPSYALGTVHYVHGDYMHEIPAHYNLMFTDVNYRQTPPVMVHFLGRDKPWSGHVTDMQTSAYFRRYAVECQRCEHIISDDFLKKVRATSQLI